MSVNSEQLAETGRLFRHRQFRLYWVSRLLGQTAQAALLYGLLILIVDQTSSGFWASLFVVCSIVPSVLFGLAGGWVADWLPQRMLMLVLNLVRTAIVGFLIWSEITLPLIFGVTVGIWVVHQMYSPAESAIVARLVSEDRLASATALYNLALSLAQLLGMVLIAPVLLSLQAPVVLFTVCAGLYAAAALMLARMGSLAPQPRGELTPAAERITMSLRTGWRVMVNDRPAFSALVDSVLVGVGLSALVVIVPQYLERVLDTAANNTVYVFAPGAIGLVLGLQLAPILGRIVGHGLLAAGGLVMFAMSVLAIGVVEPIAAVLEYYGILVGTLDTYLGLPPRVSTTMLIALPAGIAVALVNVASRTLLLQRVPSDTRARVFATQMMLANLGALAPTLLAGAMIDFIGVQPVAILIALALLFGAVYGRRIGGDARLPAPGPETPLRAEG